MNKCQKDAHELPALARIRSLEVVRKLLASGELLRNKHRTEITKAVMMVFLTPYRTLSSEDFHQLADATVEIFPTEVKSASEVRRRMANYGRSIITTEMSGV